MPFHVTAEAPANSTNALGKLPSELTLPREVLLVERKQRYGRFLDPEEGEMEEVRG